MIVETVDIYKKRIDNLRKLEQYYLENLVEDCIEGSYFDDLILNTFNRLRKEIEQKVIETDRRNFHIEASTKNWLG